MASLTRRIDLARANAVASLRRLDWLPLLVARVILGVVFLHSGIGKLADLGKVTSSFANLGIPDPGFSAHLVAYSEVICGGLLMVGLLTRLATIPLIVTMMVALATAKAKEIASVPALLSSVDFTFLALLLFLLVMGPGMISLDAAIARWSSSTARRHGARARWLDYATSN